MDINVIEDTVEIEDVDPQLQHAIHQQHLMLEQQRHEELMRIQQKVVEQQYEVKDRNVVHRRQDEDLFLLQQEALRQSMSGPPPNTTGPNMLPPGTGPTMLPPGVTMGSDDMHPPGIDPQSRDSFNRPPMLSQPSLLRQQPPSLLSLPVGVEASVAKQDHQESKLPSLMSLKVEPPIDINEVKLPMALEQALAFKTERAKQIGVEEEESHSPELMEDSPLTTRSGLENIYDPDDEEEVVVESGKPSQVDEDRNNKNKRKKKKKKRAKNRQQPPQSGDKKGEDEETGEKEAEPEIEYITEHLGFNELEPMYRQFAKIFEAFRIAEPESEVKEEVVEPVKLLDLKKVPKLSDDYEDEEDEEKKDDSDKPKLSKRKLKKLTRLSVAELKQLVHRPDVVEMHDVTAKDPKLLVQLKAHRNTVPVPRHWCFKRKYLQGKRGIEKPPFDLPEFIKKTGIMEMRAALQEKEDQRTLKAKMRERARPKLGKIDIDYQKLHDAFFKWQTKPRMSIHGDLYYEGKEFETRLKEKKPGDLSEDLRTALGMPVGQSAHKVPPPWLIAMQRYGPPPSYPNLKIPGLNAPIPESCSFGYHAGGWGKPPVDETGRPLYGDVFGITGQHAQSAPEEEEIDRTAWGELESESEEESEEEEDEDEEGATGGETDETGLVTPAEGLITPSGITSIPAGMETPEIIELRKRKIESEMEGGETPVLYQILPEKRMDRMGNAMMASTHIYDMTGGGGPQLPSAQLAPPRRGPGEGTVELALDPSELDLDNDAMAMRYEQQIREQQSNLQKEDLSDMLADHVARQKNKRKQRQQHQDSKQAKKYKEFKF